jgi:hypothetical protein
VTDTTTGCVSTVCDTLKVWNEIYGWSIDLCIRQMTLLMNLGIWILTVLSLKVDDDVYPIRWRTNEKSGGPWNKATGLCNAEAVFCTNSNSIPKQRFDVNFRFEVLRTAIEMWKITDPHYGNSHGWEKATHCIFIRYLDLRGYVHERTKWQDNINSLRCDFSLPRARFSNRVATCGTRGIRVRVFGTFLTNHRSAAGHSNLSPSA